MKTLFITERPFLGDNLVQKLSMLYPEERFEYYGNYHKSDSYFVTWATGHLFRASAASLSRREMEDRIVSMSRDHKICPDWDFESIDASSKRRFEILKFLINSPEVDSIVHAGGYHTDGEVMIRIILHMASVKKPILRLASITRGYDEFAIMMNDGLPSVSCFDFLAEEGFQNMLMSD